MWVCVCFLVFGRPADFALLSKIMSFTSMAVVNRLLLCAFFSAATVAAKMKIARKIETERKSYNNFSKYMQLFFYYFQESSSIKILPMLWIHIGIYGFRHCCGLFIDSIEYICFEMHVLNEIDGRGRRNKKNTEKQTRVTEIEIAGHFFFFRFMCVCFLLLFIHFYLHFDIFYHTHAHMQLVQ